MVCFCFGQVMTSSPSIAIIVPISFLDHYTIEYELIMKTRGVISQLKYMPFWLYLLPLIYAIVSLWLFLLKWEHAT